MTATTRTKGTRAAAAAPQRRSGEVTRRSRTPVEAAPRPRRTLRITTVALSLLAMLLLFGLVGFQALIVSNQSVIDDLDVRLDEVNRTNQRLRLEVAELEAPDRITSIALATLGMVWPERVQMLEPISAAELDPVEPQR